MMLADNTPLVLGPVRSLAMHKKVYSRLKGEPNWIAKMYLFFVAQQMYNFISDLRFNKSALSNCSFVKTFCCKRCYWNTGMCFLCLQRFFSINLWEALQVYQGNHQGVLEETLLERLRSFGEIADGSYFGHGWIQVGDSSFKNNPPILLQGNKQANLFKSIFVSSKSWTFSPSHCIVGVPMQSGASSRISATSGPWWSKPLICNKLS